MFSWTQVFAGRSLFAHSDSRPSRRIYDILHHDEILCMTSHLRYCDVPILPLDALRDVRGGTFRIKLCIKITQNFTHPYFISEPCLHLNKYRRYCDTRHSSNPSTGGRGGNHGYIRRSFYLRSSFSSRPSPEQHLYQMQYTISGSIHIRRRDPFVPLDFTIVHYLICRLLFRKYSAYNFALFYITIEGRYFKLVLGKLSDAIPDPGLPTHRG